MREKTNHGRQTPSASSLGVDRWRVDQEVQREAMKLARKMPKELPRGSATEKGDSGRIEPLWEKKPRRPVTLARSTATRAHAHTKRERIKKKKKKKA